MNRSIFHPGRLLKRELRVRKLSANRLLVDIAVVEREKGGEIAKRVRPADAA